MQEAETGLPTADDLQLQQLMDKDGTTYVDNYPPIRDGNGWATRCPTLLASMMGLPEAETIHTWVNLEENAIIHKIPDGAEVADD